MATMAKTATPRNEEARTAAEDDGENVELEVTMCAFAL